MPPSNMIAGNMLPHVCLIYDMWLHTRLLKKIKYKYICQCKSILDSNCGKVSGLLVVYIPFKYSAKNTQLVITLYNLYNSSMDIYPLIYIS